MVTKKVTVSDNKIFREECKMFFQHYASEFKYNFKVKMWLMLLSL